MSKAKTAATIEHNTPVATHWNNNGHDQTQLQRANWYNDTTNLSILCGPCNSSLGSGGVTYNSDVGPNFVGP